MSDSNNDSLDALRDRLSKLGVDVDVDTVDTNTVPGVSSGGVAAASEVCFSLFILTVAAAESSIGLALLVIYYRARGTVAVEFINLMKG